MAQSISAGAAHTARLHHHRDRVRQARQAITDAAEAVVATHYDHTRLAGPQLRPESPDDQAGSKAPPTAETPASDPLGADRKAPDE